MLLLALLAAALVSASAVPNITTIALVGERNTGTNWLRVTLEANFAVPVVDQYCGWKHFFHYKESCTPAELAQLDTTLVVVLHKNAHDWLLSMHKHPYHAPMHFLDSFAHFLRRPWALVDTFELSDAISAGLRAGGGELPVRFGRPPLAHNLTSAGDAPLSSFSDDSYCSKRLVPSWHWQHAVFCSDSVDHRAALMPPFYELDTAVLRVRRHAETTGNNNTATDGLLGVPFPNVIALRSAKIRNFLEIREWIANVEHARFEDLIGQDGRGAADFIARLKADYDLPVHEGGPVLPQPPANWSPSPAARQAVEAANNASAAWPFVLRYNPKTFVPFDFAAYASGMFLNHAEVSANRTAGRPVVTGAGPPLPHCCDVIHDAELRYIVQHLDRELERAVGYETSRCSCKGRWRARQVRSGAVADE